MTAVSAVSFVILPSSPSPLARTYRLWPVGLARTGAPEGLTRGRCAAACGGRRVFDPGCAAGALRGWTTYEAAALIPRPSSMASAASITRDSRARSSACALRSGWSHFNRSRLFSLTSSSVAPGLSPRTRWGLEAFSKRTTLRKAALAARIVSAEWPR